MWTSHWHWSKTSCNSHSVSLFVCLFVYLFQFSFFSFSFDKLLIFDFSFEYRDKGLTPEIPSDCPQKLVELMQMCWKKQPQQRPVSSIFCFCFFFLSFCFFISHTHHNTTICFVSSLIEMLIGFCNNLCNVRRMEFTKRWSWLSSFNSELNERIFKLTNSQKKQTSTKYSYWIPVFNFDRIVVL
jgi:hypothetical protein